MDINLVLHQGESWILGKFAYKMEEHLREHGCNVKVSNRPDTNTLVNHHFIYYDYHPYNRNGVDTLMITHVDEWGKWKQLRNNLRDADAGICMSSYTLKKMRWAGLPMSKLLYINPAHDGIIRTPRVKIGFFSNVQLDGRKREYMISRALINIDPSSFHFIFMGVGWENTCQELDQLGVSYTLYSSFDYDTYFKEMNSIDYLLYTGMDEGSMSFLDAVLLNKRTIVTKQGFHCDIRKGINLSFNTIDELNRIFRRIASEFLQREKDVQMLTWENYSLKHLEVWDYLAAKERKKRDSAKKSTFKDGINSLKKTSSIKVFLLPDILFYSQKFIVWFGLFKAFTIRYGWNIALKKGLQKIKN